MLLLFLFFNSSFVGKEYMGGGGGGTGITFETLSYALFKKSLLVKPATTLRKTNF